MSERELTEWRLCYKDWDADEQPLREALTTLGNGYFACRGAVEESPAGGPHYPGTYLAGGYNRLESEVNDHTIENEDLVNWPNWLPLTFRVDDGPWFDLDSVDILDYQLELDLRRGVLRRRVHFRDGGEREFHLEVRRIVSLASRHLAAIEWTLTPIDRSCAIEVRSGIDGSVENRGVPRYRGLNGRHLEIIETGSHGEEGIWLVARTNQSHIVMAQAVRTRCFLGSRPAPTDRRTRAEAERVEQVIHVDCEADVPFRLEKTLALYTSRDVAISEPRHEACLAASQSGRFEALLDEHERAWRHMWKRVDVGLGDSDVGAQLILRLHIFHLMQVASVHTVDLDVGVPARGLHGEAYRGHIFWDELFIFPFLNLSVPELTRSLLMYRYRRLDQARRAARNEGYRGAMFPWQSGSNGREESQVLHLNPRTGRWIPDHTHRQRHVNAAIAFNVWQYYQATDDTEFLSFYGAEMLLEIARFWASSTTYNPHTERYEIREVVGPDEFHTQYPDTDSRGLNNNAYTNVMAAWVLRTARTALDTLSEHRREELLEKTRIEPDELDRWDIIASNMFVPFHGDGIISQFEGWEDLEELDWEGLEERYDDIQRLDRILDAEGDDPNRYKASKQADVLMLFFLLSAEELTRLLESMGYEPEGDWIPRNVEYYRKRTSHGSTLSNVVHAWVLSRSDRSGSWDLFREALGSDIDDIQGGTTPEGIHLGAMAGTVDLIQRCYMGIETREDVLWLNPELPTEMREMACSLRYRGHWLDLHISQQELTVRFREGWSGPAKIGFRGRVFEMCQDETHTFDLALSRMEMSHEN